MWKISSQTSFEGKDFKQKVKEDHQLELEVVKRKHS